MFQKTLFDRKARDGSMHAAGVVQSMEDLFWLFVPRGQFFGPDITPELRSLVWKVLSRRLTEQDIRKIRTSPADQRSWRELRGSLNLALDQRAGQVAFATKIGYVGVSVPVIEVGDIVALVYGMAGPFIFRPVNDGTYHMVGFAYVHGFMDPDVLSEWKDQGLFEGVETTFNIS